MNSKILILIGLAILGTVLSYSQFLPWYLEHGFDLKLLFQEPFTTRIGAGLAWDLVVSSLIVFSLIFWDRKTIGCKWGFIIAVCVIFVGVFLGLAVYLIRKEIAYSRLEH